MGVGCWCYGAVASWRAPLAQHAGRIVCCTGESWGPVASPHLANVIDLSAGSCASAARGRPSASDREDESTKTAGLAITSQAACRRGQFWADSN